MLPEYKVPTLTSETLTDDVMNTALERKEYTAVSRETARAVCYQWMSTSSVSLSDLTLFLQQLPEEEKTCADCPLLVVETLCKEVRDILCGEAAICHLPRLEPQKVAAAMEKVSVHVDIEQMSMMLAHLVVGGLAYMAQTFAYALEEGNISAVQVVEVAEAYNIDITTEKE